MLGHTAHTFCKVTKKKLNEEQNKNLHTEIDCNAKGKRKEKKQTSNWLNAKIYSKNQPKKINIERRTWTNSLKKRTAHAWREKHIHDPHQKKKMNNNNNQKKN